MGLKLPLMILSCALAINQCEAGGATCSRFIDIVTNSVELLVNTSGTPCVRCLATPTSPVAGNTFYFIDGGPTTGRTDVEVVGGVLIILDPDSVIPDGNSPLLLSCQVLGGFEHDDIELRSNNLTPPTISPESLTINEGGNIDIHCLFASPRALMVDEMWLNPQMMAAEGVGNILRFVNISRNQSGVYRCILTSRVTNQRMSATFPVTVHYRPEVRTTEAASHFIILGRDLRLSCNFDGVPIPDVTWIQNNTIELSDSDPRIIITTGNDVSTLQITGTDRNGGGLYTCRSTNSVGSREVDVTTVMILTPTAPRDVTLTGLTSFALIVTWEPPEDDGAIVSYIVSVAGLTFTQPASARMLRIVDNMVLLEDTTYTVTVRAVYSGEESAGGPVTGPAATATARTLSIEQPQAILSGPAVANISNSTALLRWEDPGGNVDRYLIQYTNTNLNLVFTVTVSSSITSHLLTGLDVATSYSVVVFSMNSNGFSAASPPSMFDSLPPTPPYITGPDGVSTVGSTIVLFCTSPDIKPIMWFESSRNLSLVPPVFEINGSVSSSQLTINNIQLNHSGVYVCQVRDATAMFEVSIVDPVSATSQSCSTSNALAASISAIISAIITAILATTIFMLVHNFIAVQSNKTAGIEHGDRDEQMYETVGVDPVHVEMEGGGGGAGNAYKLKRNEAYATDM